MPTKNPIMQDKRKLMDCLFLDEPQWVKTHTFYLIVSGIDFLDTSEIDRLYESGCDDATPVVSSGIYYLVFDREGESLSGAIKSAIENVRSAGGKVERIEIYPDDIS